MREIGQSEQKTQQRSITIKRNSCQCFEGCVETFSVSFYIHFPFCYSHFSSSHSSNSSHCSHPYSSSFSHQQNCCCSRLYQANDANMKLLNLSLKELIVRSRPREWYHRDYCSRTGSQRCQQRWSDRFPKSCNQGICLSIEEYLLPDPLNRCLLRV